LLATPAHVMATGMSVERRTYSGDKDPTAPYPDDDNSPPADRRHALPTQGQLSNKEVPLWYTQPFIHTGYRPVMNSVKFCFQSLTYMHNESVNIYSHLVPAIVALVAALVVPWYFRTNFPKASRQDRLIFEIYLSTSVICFTTSSLYHTLLCHSQPYFNLWVRIDYVAILVQILGSFISGIYLGFYCEPWLQKLHWSMVWHQVTPNPPV
jgi:adiponectin receptor